jgi:hypothetical protein
MKAVQLCLDETTAKQLEEFAQRFDAPITAVTAGLVRAALRYQLRPEASLTPRGRQGVGPAHTVYRKLVTHGAMLPDTLIASYPEDEKVDAKWFLEELFRNRRVEILPDGRVQLKPKYIPLHTEMVKETAVQ